MTGISAHGRVIIHSAPRVLLSHIEWTLSRHFGDALELDWKPSGLVSGEFMAEALWQADSELGASLASDLRGWANLRFEVTQQASDQTEGYRWAFTPTLGMFSAQTDRFGSVLLNEHELGRILAVAGFNASEMQRLISDALGTAWDVELDVHRAQQWDQPQRLRSIS